MSFVAVTLGADGLRSEARPRHLMVMVTSFETLPPPPSSTFTLTLYVHVVGSSLIIRSNVTACRILVIQSRSRPYLAGAAVNGERGCVTAFEPVGQRSRSIVGRTHSVAYIPASRRVLINTQCFPSGHCSVLLEWHRMSGGSFVSLLVFTVTTRDQGLAPSSFVRPHLH